MVLTAGQSTVMVAVLLKLLRAYAPFMNGLVIVRWLMNKADRLLYITEQMRSLYDSLNAGLETQIEDNKGNQKIESEIKQGEFNYE